MNEDEEKNIQETGTKLKEITDEMIEYMIEIHDVMGLTILGGMLAHFCELQSALRDHHPAKAPEPKNADQEALNKLKEKYQNGNL
jgi:mannose/fructose/N-acetylgalactosamine-specific phosphotransferase system component IID